MNTAVRILGIDPGSQITGYGVVELVGTLARPVAWGGIRTSGSHPERLKQIYFALGKVIEQHFPDEIAIERVFVHRNADSALKLGQARAAALCATFTLDLPIHEYATRHIKKALVGTGAAEKAQVQHMVKLVLGLRGEIEADAADALAAAVCHAHERRVLTLIERAVPA